MATPEPRSRLKIGVGAAVALVIAAAVCAVAFSALAPRGSTEIVTSAPTAVATDAPAELFVHVLGHVASPGLYAVADGSRVVDVIAAAGGFTADADQSALNLARPVSDGEQLIVLAVGEAPAPASAANGTTPSGKVDLNTADEAALETLPRVGPALAQRILDWREQNGRFSSIDDLKSVTGIGEKTFAGLEDLVTI